LGTRGGKNYFTKGEDTKVTGVQATESKGGVHALLF